MNCTTIFEALTDHVRACFEKYAVEVNPYIDGLEHIIDVGIGPRKYGRGGDDRSVMRLYMDEECSVTIQLLLNTHMDYKLVVIGADDPGLLDVIGEMAQNVITRLDLGLR